LLLKDQELTSKLEAIKAKAETRGWAASKHLFVYSRWLKFRLNSDILDVTKYFQQFKKLVTGWGNTTEIEACHKFKIDGYSRLSSTLPPWLVALLSDFLVWKPVNEVAYKSDMLLFDAAEKRPEYKLNQSLSAITPATFDGLVRQSLGLDRKAKPVGAEMAKFLNSRDPQQTYVAFKIALQQSFAPVDELDFVLEFKRPYFPRGGVNWSFLLVTKEVGLIFNLSTKSD